MGPWEIQARILKSKRVAATAVGFINLSPTQIWELLTLPDGAEIFRVEGRIPGIDDKSGCWEEEVIFTAAVRVLFWKTLARTRVHQFIDASNPKYVTVEFRLLQSDLMSHLQGSWQLQQVAAAAPHSTAVTKVTYTFEMWPKGVPSGLRFMPGLMGAVKDAVKREAAQLLDKVHYVACKVQPGLSIQQALQEVTAEVIASGGSFKLLQQAQQQQQQQQQQRITSTSSGSSTSDVRSPAAAPVVLCHALPDDFQCENDCEDSQQSDEDDTMADFDSECYCEIDSPRCASDSSSAELSSSSRADRGSGSMVCSSLRLSDTSDDSSGCITADGACVIVDAESNSSDLNSKLCNAQPGSNLGVTPQVVA